MNGWITAGNARQDDLPRDKLTDPELQELHKLLGARQALGEQVAMIEQRLELLVISARDRRGFVGKIRVRPEDGAIEEDSK